MRVVKVGGRIQADPSLVAGIARAWQESPGKLCVVHGGGDEISDTQRRLGLEPKMSNGRRVTTADDLTVVRMVLSGVTNKRMVSALIRAGVTAVGISGEDGGLLCAEARDAATLGMVGKTPVVRAAILHTLLRDRMLPVISPVSGCADVSLSDALNVNGDDAAAAIAIALEADELVFVSDVAAVRASSGESVRQLDPDSAQDMIENGAAEGGMAAKLEAALTAIAGGVARVRIGTIEMLTDQNAGTLIRSATGVVR
ncbi:MAG: acetylglutamate kinase [Gemmatimonadaceae bacterium]|nr:acetylglutamate kinase [Gemmatimonadaceae bacterium]